jgi:uncharacterized membrane protein YbhN (UPF0104 family)
MGLVAFGLALAYLFSIRVGWGELLGTLAAFEWKRAPQIVIGQICFLALGGLALSVLVSGRHAIGLRTLLVAYWRSVAVGVWTPAAIGELSLAWLLRPFGLPLQDGLALITLDKLITALAYGMFALPVLGWVLGPLRNAALGPQGLALLVALVTVAIAFLIASRSGRLRTLTMRFLAGAGDYLRSIYGLAFGSPARLAGDFLLTVVRVVVGALVLQWSLAAFEPRHSATFGAILVSSSAARLLALSLAAPNGLGVYEVALVELLPPAGVTPAGVLSAVVVSRVIGLAVVGLGLLVPARQAVSATAPDGPRAGVAGGPVNGSR